MALMDSPIPFLFKKTWEYSKDNRKNVILYICLFLMANAINFVEPLVVGWVLNTIQEMGVNQASLPRLISIISLFLALQIGFWMFHGPARVIERNNAFLVRANYKKYLLEGTMNLPAEWHVNHHSGNTIDKIEKATTSLYNFSQDTYEIIETALRLIGSYFALVYFDPSAGYIVFFGVIITVTMILKFDKVLIVQYKELFKAENRISAKIFDVISNITTVIILRIEKLLLSDIMQKVMHPFALHKKNIRMNELKWALVSFMTAIMIFLVLSSFIYSNVRNGTTILVGTMYILYGYIQRINGTFYRFAYKYGQIVMQKTAVQNVEPISSKFEVKKKKKESSLTNDWKEISIENLDFSYDAEDELHLNDVSIKIRRNQKIALVGESGSGKTTLLKVIRELYHPKGARVRLDNRKLDEGFSSISSDIALIPQEPEIFNTTIRDNITMGVDYPLKQIKKYTDMAEFTNVVNKLPNKLNSHIVEKGVNLSGGEKQRLALTRGLMACEGKQIVLLDEPTSSVDLKNELKIFKNISKAFRNKTIISSIHRLHLLHLFDTVYFFDKGKLVGSGTLSELKRNCPPFKKVWDKHTKKPRMNKTDGRSSK